MKLSEQNQKTVQMKINKYDKDKTERDWINTMRLTSKNNLNMKLWESKKWDNSDKITQTWQYKTIWWEVITEYHRQRGLEDKTT